uniref:Mitochondrial import receptor subunit TOM7 homolog n=1 Tax=Fundulus heteroclitus TaxID=8078 RepID=A0A3Q2TW21_FUNHE
MAPAMHGKQPKPRFLERRDPRCQDKHMAKLSKETKQRLQQLFQCSQFVIRWGFIPTVLYLGFKRGADPGMPEPTILR